MVALLITGVLVLAACGSSSTKTAATTTPATTAAPAATDAPTTQAPSTTEAGAVDPAELDALVTAAKAEGALNFYSAGVKSTNDQVAAAFEKKYGIKVTMPERTTDLVMLKRFLTELDAGGSPADLLQLTAQPPIKDAKDAGKLLSVDAMNIPGIKTYPKDAQTDYAVMVSVLITGLCYNTDQLKATDVDEWAKLKDPKVHMIFADPALTVPYSAFWLTAGLDVVKAVGQNQHVIAASTVPGFASLTAGEGNVLASCPEVLVKGGKAKGAPVAWASPSPPTGIQFGLSESATAPHKAAARLFLYWATTEEGQAAFNGNGAGASQAFPKGTGGSSVLDPAYKPFDYAAAKSAEAQIKELLGVK